MKKVFFGIDTSNYRTSVAAVDIEGNTIAQKAVLLDVPEGKRGLRQSEAFFRHSNRLPAYIDEIFDAADPSDIAAIGVSERPRRVEGSYMPCFLAGVNAAHEIASALKIPFYGFSHQEGHAAAVFESGGSKAPERSLFFHLSGGTTEALLCCPDERGYSMEIVGGSLDISVGQLLDRFGVAMGKPFPSGAYIDEAAFEVLSSCPDMRQMLKNGMLSDIKTDDGWFNLSGIETKVQRIAEKRSGDAELFKELSAELLMRISGLLTKEAAYLAAKYGTDKICMAGGVASSRTLRMLMSGSGEIKIGFGEPALSCDNAVGTALLAKRMYETGNCISGK